MNNNEPKFNEGNQQHFNSFENSNGFGNDNFLNQDPSVAPLSDSIRVPGNVNDFKTKTNPPFNSSYISQALEINGTEIKPQHNKPIYQPIIYQPFVMLIMANPMGNMGMGPYNPMMMGCPQMFPYPMMPQFPLVMGYPQMSQYPGMWTYPPMAGPEVGQQAQGMQQQSSNREANFGEKHSAQDNSRHYAIMNHPDLMKQQQQMNGDFDDNFQNFNNSMDDFNNENAFGSSSNDFRNGSSFTGQNDFEQGTSSFGPTPDFNAVPSFSSSPDFAPTNTFNNNSNVLGKIDSTRMPLQYEEGSSRWRLPVWAIILIIVLVILVLAVITIVMLYFNLEAVNNLINDWFGLDIPFNPWF